MQRLAKNYPDRFGARYGKLPIGADYYGNVIYLYLSGPEKNSVYFWMHNADTDDDKVSPSFSAFLNSLRDEPPPKDRQNPANDLPS
jgi:hypothetical protein